MDVMSGETQKFNMNLESPNKARDIIMLVCDALEVKGYNMVKDFLGKHVPTFTLPVSYKGSTGIGMELAAMEGAPSTLQEKLEDVDNDYTLDAFIELFDRTLGMLSNKIYSNTKSKKKIAPYRHFSLQSDSPLCVSL